MFKALKRVFAGALQGKSLQQCINDDHNIARIVSMMPSKGIDPILFASHCVTKMAINHRDEFLQIEKQLYLVKASQK
jgi:hypothetical protein